MTKWIDITEQLPTSSKEVLVRCKHSVKHYGIAKYESGSWWEYFADDSIKGWAAFEGEITHWMDIENLQEPASPCENCEGNELPGTCASISSLDRCPLEYNKEPASEDLEQAAEECVDGEDYPYTDGEGMPLYTSDYLTYMFRQGAEWQKEQMMKDAVETTVCGVGSKEKDCMVGGEFYTSVSIPPFNIGDKVKVIILPSDNKND